MVVLEQVDMWRMKCERSSPMYTTCDGNRHLSFRAFEDHSCRIDSLVCIRIPESPILLHHK